MSQVFRIFTLAIWSRFLLCICLSLPLGSHEVPEDSIDTTEIDTEYICSSDYSISDLKKLAPSNYSCTEKDYDLEFWLAACRCKYEPHVPCPDCQQTLSPTKGSTGIWKSTSTSRPMPIDPPQTTPNRVMKSANESETHGKLIRNPNTTSNSINFIRFG